MSAKLKTLDTALTAQNKGAFFGYDTRTVKKGAGGKSALFLRTTSKGQIANATTDYVRRVLSQNPDFTPKESWHVKKDGFENLRFHPKTDKAYLALPYRTDAKSNAIKTYEIGKTANGPWTPCTYEEGQNILTNSQRDDYKPKSNNGTTVGFKTLKAESVIAIRTGGMTIQF